MNVFIKSPPMWLSAEKIAVLISQLHENAGGMRRLQPVCEVRQSVIVVLMMLMMMKYNTPITQSARARTHARVRPFVANSVHLRRAT